MYYIHSNNTKIAVEDINSNGKETILFIHGWPLNHKMFEYQTDILLKHDFRVIAIDLRGFGMSDTTFKGYSYDQMSNDIYTVISNIGIKKFTLVGFSMGGAIAIRYMNLFKGYKVSKLALLAAAAPVFTRRSDYPYGMSKEDVDLLITQTYLDRPQMISDFGEKFFASKHSDNFREWFKQMSWSNSATGTIATAESLRDEDLRNDLKYIKVPTGIFHGILDQICPFEFAKIIHKGIINSKLYEFKHSGHGIFYDELEYFNECFLSFLQDC